mgnify:CR=1 FL=1
MCQTTCLICIKRHIQYIKNSEGGLKNWRKQGDFYTGIEAVSLIEKGAKQINALPGAYSFEVKRV